MRLLFLIAFFLHTGTELILSFPSKSLVITEKQISSYGSKVICCESDSSAVEIYWTDPNGKRIDYLPSENIFSVKQENKSSLIVQNIGKDQEGLYTCHKYDGKGNHYQEIHQLATSELIELSADETGLPEFEKKFEDITVSEGSDVELLCQAKGDPEPTYTWISPAGTEIVEKDGRMYVKNVDNGLLLTIMKVSFDLKGMYACNAENKHGLVTKIYRLDVVEATDEEGAYVEDATVIEVTENSLHFFLDIANTTTDEFQIFVIYNDSSNETRVTWNSGDKFEIINLEAGGRYDFRFRIGQYGKWSKSYQEVLLPAAPDVIVESFSGGNLVLTFYRKISDFMKRTIDKHRVTYTRLQIEAGENFIPAKCNMSVEIPECMGNKYIVSGLSNKSYYEIQVEAHTSAGYGKPYKHKIYVQY